MKEKIPEHVRGRIAYLRLINGEHVLHKDIKNDPMIEFITQSLIKSGKVVGQSTFWDEEKQNITTEHEIVLYKFNKTY